MIYPKIVPTRRASEISVPSPSGAEESMPELERGKNSYQSHKDHWRSEREQSVDHGQRKVSQGPLHPIFTADTYLRAPLVRPLLELAAVRSGPGSAPLSP